MKFKDSPNKWAIFTLVAVGIFMSTLDGSIVNIALPHIMKSLRAPFEKIEWVVMIYLLTVSSLLLGFGRLSDIKGRRWVYTRGLIIFSLGSLLCSISHSIWTLIMSRSIQGLGAAMIMACTPALIVDTFSDQERGKALGMVGTVVASGLTTGPALGGILLSFLNWRAIFYINVPIGICAAVMVNHVLKGSRADVIRNEKFDVKGAILIVIFLGAFILTVAHGYEWGGFSYKTISLSVITLSALFGLIWAEKRIAFPVIEWNLFGIRLFTFPVLAGIFLFAALFSIVFLMPFYLEHPCHYSVEKAGLMMVTPFVFLFLFSPLSGALSDRIGSRMLCTIGMGILSMAIFSMTQLTATSQTTSILWRLSLAGIGTAIFISPNSSAALGSVPPQRRGLASGMVATARNLGMVLGIAIAGSVFSLVFYKLSHGGTLKIYTDDLESIFLTSFHWALVSGGIIATIGMVLSFLRGKDTGKG